MPVLVGLLGRVAPDPAAVGFARAAVRCVGQAWLRFPYISRLF